MPWKKSLEDIFKSAPLIIGGVAGLITPSKHTNSPVVEAMGGQWGSAFAALTANYTFYSDVDQKFDLGEGRGVKLGVAGIAIHKVIGWISGA